MHASAMRVRSTTSACSEQSFGVGTIEGSAPTRSVEGWIMSVASKLPPARQRRVKCDEVTCDGSLALCESHLRFMDAALGIEDVEERACARALDVFGEDR